MSTGDHRSTERTCNEVYSQRGHVVANIIKCQGLGFEHGQYDIVVRMVKCGIWACVIRNHIYQMCNPYVQHMMMVATSCAHDMLRRYFDNARCAAARRCSPGLAACHHVARQDSTLTNDLNWPNTKESTLKHAHPKVFGSHQHSTFPF